MITCPTKYKISKKFLIQEYIKNKKSMYIIAKSLNCSYPVIRKNLLKYKIKIRNYSEAVKNSYGKYPELKVKAKGKQCGSYKAGYYSKYAKKYNECIDCGIKIDPKAKRCHSCANKIRLFSQETRKKMSLALGGTGIPFENRNYPSKFYELREQIRKRDNYTCVICNKFGKHVHHIDYDKQNCVKHNLITLCLICHLKTNINRKYWKNYFIKLRRLIWNL